MNHILKLFTFLLLIMSSSVVLAEDTLEKTLDEFQNAFSNADVQLLSNLITDDYLHTNASGNVIGKEDWLNWLSGRRKDMDANIFSYTTYEIKDRQIKYYEKMAIVSSLIQTAGINKAGDFLTNIRTTEVWIKENSNWSRAAFHDSYLAN